MLPKIKIQHFLLLFILLLASCNIERRLYLPGLHISNNSKIGHLENSSPPNKIVSLESEKKSTNTQYKNSESIDSTQIQDEPDNCDHLSGCDTIFLTDSTFVIAQVMSYRDGYYVYKNCDALNSNIDSVRSENVLLIHRDIANGDLAESAFDTRRTELLGLIGFLFLFTAWLAPTPIISIILGAISVNKQTQRPNEFKNKSFAYISLIGGAILFVLWILLILIVLTLVYN